MHTIKRLVRSARNWTKKTFKPVEHREKQLEVVVDTLFSKNLNTLALEALEVLGENSEQAQRKVADLTAQLVQLQKVLSTAQLEQLLKSGQYDMVAEFLTNRVEK